MMRRCHYILLSIIVIAQCLVSSEIAFFTRPLAAQEQYLNNDSEAFFVCTVETSVPTLYIYKAGKTSLTPLIKWHQEYLLPQDSGSEVCQQVARKLQHLYPKQRYITTEEKEDRTLVCMVEIAHETCSSNYSEALFGINPNYDAQCILARREPLECVAVGGVRGVFSVPDSPYKPIWWLW